MVFVGLVPLFASDCLVNVLLGSPRRGNSAFHGPRFYFYYFYYYYYYYCCCYYYY